MELIANNTSAISQFIRDYVENSGFEITDESTLLDVARYVRDAHSGQDYVLTDCIDIEELDRAYDFIA